MIKQLLSHAFKGLPLSLLDRLSQLESNPTASRIVRLGVKNRNVTICNGVGAGLKFNAGSSNPDYALGTNEYPVQQALARYLKPGDTFYDIGANIGFFTVIGARLVGSTGRVYAFEPVPENAASLQRNADLNQFHHVTVFGKAVSRSQGKGELLLTHHPGGATLSIADHPPDMKGTIAIDLVSIDHLIAQQKLAPPAVVKIDVEGAELDVLHGMSQTIKEFKPAIICEIDAQHKENFIRKNKEFEAFMRALGYEITPLKAAYPATGWHVGHTVATPSAA